MLLELVLLKEALEHPIKKYMSNKDNNSGLIIIKLAYNPNIRNLSLSYL